MKTEYESHRSSFFGAIFPVSIIALVSYLTYAALQGEHGLFKKFQFEAQIHQLYSDLARLKSERMSLANKTRLLSVDDLDFDQLDEQARLVLGLGRTDEMIIR